MINIILWKQVTELGSYENKSLFQFIAPVLIFLNRIKKTCLFNLLVFQRQWNLNLLKFCKNSFFFNGFQFLSFFPTANLAAQYYIG